ncbi:GNAT family N-acetyltransferase [Clostridium manihotivorum]|uniref:N-acetyltransferase n=1 Tax=Clostridium manihotivorum TaxID=2320868 RepID=A0A410DWQ3_9CLOT|nr:GNAT family N-acetyltransferase [Clostridium manihotivorum]QAA33408.1 N-acetyltransferase [Clostridium manihotivorum]
MKLLFEEFKDEIEELVSFLTADSWEFFGTPNQKEERIREAYKNGTYNSEYCKTFWIMIDSSTRAGFIRIYDLEDDIPVFDIRLSSKYRGKGIGTIAVNWMVDYIFNNFPDKTSIEGYTRQDNYPMRNVFHKCGFVKEAHHRNGWVCSDGRKYDSIGYGFIKEDWKKGTSTPVQWNDYKF